MNELDILNEQNEQKFKNLENLWKEAIKKNLPYLPFPYLPINITYKEEIIVGPASKI